MKKLSFERKSFLKKTSFSLGIILVYLFGRNLVLPVISTQMMSFTNTIRDVGFLTGAQLESRSLFSLGFSPWMSSMILWNLLSKSKLLKDKKLTAKTLNLLQMLLMLIIAIIQSLGIISTLELEVVPLFGISSPFLTETLTCLLLVTGSVIISWLISMNNAFGVGGSSLFILVSMLLGMFNRITEMILEPKIDALPQHILILILVSSIVIVTYLSVIMEFAELRLPFNRINLHNKYSEKTYFSLKLLPAGAMPMMFSFIMMSLFNYIILALFHIWSNNERLQWFLENLQMTKPLGAGIYLVLIFTLSIVFAYVNIDIDEITDNLKESGDYFIGIKPGQATRTYLKKKMSSVSVIGATYMSLLIGLPTLSGVIIPSMADVASVMGISWMSIGMSIMIYQQYQILKIRERYKTLL